MLIESCLMNITKVAVDEAGETSLSPVSHVSSSKHLSNCKCKAGEISSRSREALFVAIITSSPNNDALTSPNEKVIDLNSKKKGFPAHKASVRYKNQMSQQDENVRRSLFS